MCEASDIATLVSTEIHLRVLSCLLRDADSSRLYYFIPQGVLFDEKHQGLCQEDGAHAGSWGCGIGKMFLQLQTHLKPGVLGAPWGEFIAGRPYGATAGNPPAFLPFTLKTGGKKAEDNTLQSQRSQALTELPNLTDSK